MEPQSILDECLESRRYNRVLPTGARKVKSGQGSTKMSKKQRPKNKRDSELAHTLALLLTAKAVIILVVVTIILLLRWLLT